MPNICSVRFGHVAQEVRRYINARSATDSTALPFSGAVLVGNTLYLSGTIGLTMDDLVSVQVFCSDVAYYAAFNAVYRTYFTREFPARAFVGAGTLLFEARFEVQGIAVKR